MSVNCQSHHILWSKKMKTYHSTDIIVSSCCHEFEKPHTKQSRGQRAEEELCKKCWDRQERVCCVQDGGGTGWERRYKCGRPIFSRGAIVSWLGENGKGGWLAKLSSLSKPIQSAQLLSHANPHKDGPVHLLQGHAYAHTNMLGKYVYILVCICMLDCYRFIAQKCSPAHGWSPLCCNDHYSQADLISRGFIADSRIASLSPRPISVWFCAVPPLYVFTAF